MKLSKFCESVGRDGTLIVFHVTAPVFEPGNSVVSATAMRTNALRSRVSVSVPYADTATTAVARPIQRTAHVLDCSLTVDMLERITATTHSAAQMRNAH